MSNKKYHIDVVSMICKPAAIYLVATEFNVNFWVILIAAVLYTISIKIEWKY